MPIVVISARSEDSDKISALDEGADDYLTKPFSIEELLARIRANLRRANYIQSKVIESNIFENGNFKIYYSSNCVFIDEKELHLTPIEYKILCILSKNVGKVLTHKYITQQI